MGRHIIKRGRGWSYYRKTPRDVADLDGRRAVKITLKTDSETEAARKAAVLDAEMDSYWDALRAGRSADAAGRYQSAVKLARARGFDYRPMADLVSDAPVREILDRLNAIQRPAEADALLGAVEKPKITVTAAWEDYQSICAPESLSKSEEQMRRWRNPRIKAVKTFVQIIGDKPLDRISADDVLDFRDWWADRIRTEGLTANAANKDITALSAIFNRVNDVRRLGLTNPFAGRRIREGVTAARPPYDRAHIRDVILAPGALDGLNPEARAIILLLIETGARPAEICNLGEGDVVLDAPVPYLRLAATARGGKNANARRDIPLTGVSLEEARRWPQGVDRYRDRETSFSGMVNKYFRSNNLNPTPKHSVYGFRHGFQDRLTAADAPDRIQCDLMGHAFPRSKYGRGPTLEHKLQWVRRIAVAPGGDA